MNTGHNLRKKMLRQFRYKRYNLRHPLPNSRGRVSQPNPKILEINLSQSRKLRRVQLGLEQQITGVQLGH